jgi:hypothetical protein
MGARDLLESLSRAGLTVSLDPTGGLRVAPRTTLTDELRGLIRAHREELLEALSRQDVHADTPTDDRVRCLECRQLASTGNCLAAAKGDLKGVWRRYSPAPDIPRRCECFVRARILH